MGLTGRGAPDKILLWAPCNLGSALRFTELCEASVTFYDCNCCDRHNMRHSYYSTIKLKHRQNSFKAQLD